LQTCYADAHKLIRGLTYDDLTLIIVFNLLVNPRMLILAQFCFFIENGALAAFTL